MPVTVFYLVLEVKVKPHEQQQTIFLALYPIKYSWNLQSFLRRSARPWPLCLHCLILAPVCALPFQCGLQPLVSGKPGSIWAGVGALQPSVCHSGVLQGSLLRTETPVPVLQFVLALSHVYFLGRHPMLFHFFWSCSFSLYRTRPWPKGLDPSTNSCDNFHAIIRTASLLKQLRGSSSLRMTVLLAVFCILHVNIFLAGIPGAILQVLPVGNLANTQDKIDSNLYTLNLFSVAKLTEIRLYTCLLSH